MTSSRASTAEFRRCSTSSSSGLNRLGPSRPHLPFPHSSQIEGELRELRCHFGSSLYRVLYRRSGNLIVLLHMFRKDTGQVPEREIVDRPGAL